MQKDFIYKKNKMTFHLESILLQVIFAICACGLLFIYFDRIKRRKRVNSRKSGLNNEYARHKSKHVVNDLPGEKNGSEVKEVSKSSVIKRKKSSYKRDVITNF